MKIIAQISETIETFINEADEYIKNATIYKTDYPDVSLNYYNLSIQRINDIKALHDTVTKIIKDYRTENGEPPAPMMAIYNYEHNKHMKKIGEIKILQGTYKDL